MALHEKFKKKNRARYSHLKICVSRQNVTINMAATTFVWENETSNADFSKLTPATIKL
jgi:hypothetical protein